MVWAVVGVGAASIIAGGVESSENNKAAQTAGSANNATAAQLGGAQGTMLTDAENVASQPFEAYTGDLTAPMSGNQQQAYTQASNVANAGAAQSDNAAAVGQINQVADSSWNPTTEAQYMNPFTSSVTDAAITAQNKSYAQSQGALAETAAQSDAFGGSRNAIASSTLAADNNASIGSLTANANLTGYNNAMAAYQADNTTKLNAASAYEAAGQDVTQMNSQQISDLLQTGGVSQVISQTNLSNEYNQFLRQQGWSATQLGSLISAVGTAKGSPAQTPAVQSNTANNVLGMGSAIAGLVGGASSSSGTPTVANSAPSASLTNSVAPQYAPINLDLSNSIGNAGNNFGGSSTATPT